MTHKNDFLQKLARASTGNETAKSIRTRCETANDNVRHVLRRIIRCDLAGTASHDKCYMPLRLSVSYYAIA